MKKVMAWLAALCLLALSVAGVLTTAAAGNTAGTAVSGLVHDADGRIRYYENGVPVAKGLVRDDEGNVYYIWNAVNGAARGMFSIPEDKLNGIMPQGFYEFGADNRMIIKNGIYTHDWCDYTYYFVNSVPQAIGIATDGEGHYYFFTNIYGTKRAATDQFFGGVYYVSEAETNGLIEKGFYRFNSDGIMVGRVDGTDTEEPTTKPAEPTEEPTTKPTEPTEEPTTKPAEPTEEPTTKPTEPTEEPTTKPAEPTEEPTTKPAEPTEEPTTKPAESAEEPTTKPAEQTGATTAVPASGTQSDGSVEGVSGSGADGTTGAAGKSGGCASAVGVGGGVVLLVTAAAACLSRKRRH